MLVLLLAWQLMPVSQREVDRDRLDMKIETYYEVTADGHPVFFFADINDTMEASGGSVCADTITTHNIDAPGFWVNKIPLVPSCMGHIVTFAPPKPKSIVKMDSAQLRHFVIMQMIRPTIGWPDCSECVTNCITMCANTISPTMATDR